LDAINECWMSKDWRVVSSNMHPQRVQEYIETGPWEKAS